MGKHSEGWLEAPSTGRPALARERSRFDRIQQPANDGRQGSAGTKTKMHGGG